VLFRSHTARSRNDQIALDVRLFLRGEIQAIAGLLAALQKQLVKMAGSEIKTIMPGYTHMQKAQPVLLSHYFLAFVEMFVRDEQRFADCGKRLNILPLGSAALAGTGLPIDRNRTAELLNFPGVSANSMDTVADRDYIAEFIFAASLTMMHLSRFCEDLVLWSSDEFGFAEISDAYTTGSSIMPQKKNPDIAELIRGKTARVYGDLVSILTLLKGLPMTYNRDLQEDKEPLFDAVDTIRNCLAIFAEMLAHTTFNSERMREAAGGGFSTATDVAEYLVQQGVPFRRAHEIVGRIVAYCVKSKKTFADLGLKDYQKFHAGFKEDLIPRIKLENSVNARRHRGGTATSAVKERIREFEKKFGKK
jgi:argininosuccinate lyase